LDIVEWNIFELSMRLFEAFDGGAESMVFVFFGLRCGFSLSQILAGSRILISIPGPPTELEGLVVVSVVDDGVHERSDGVGRKPQGKTLLPNVWLKLVLKDVFSWTDIGVLGL
jgi:hypothetical protein